MLAIRYCFWCGREEALLGKTDFVPLKCLTLTEASVLLCAGSLCSRVLRLAFELETVI